MVAPIRIEQLLATLALDGAQAVTVADRYAIIMRDPQPGEAGIPYDWTVYLRVVDLSGVPAVPSTVGFRVFIDQGAGEVEAFDDTNILAPWNGPNAAYDESDGSDFYCWREVRLDQWPASFASEQLVTVRVELRLGDGGWGHFDWGHEDWGHAPVAPVYYSETYTFTVADITPPNLVSAVALGPRTVRVTFDDSMALGAGKADDVAAWRPTGPGDPVGFTTLNVDPLPGVDLQAVAVELVPDTGFRSFDISTQWAMTPGCPYTITVRDTATDESANPVATATAAFDGYVPAQPATRFWDYARLCVPLKNRLEDATRDLERFTNCISEPLGFVTVQVDHWLDAFDLDLCTDADVEQILNDLGNPFTWSDLDLDATQRRKLARVLVDIYRKKGTAPGIRDVVLFLLGELVTVVPYAAIGWRLGIDALGEGNIAKVACDARAPYNWPTLPATLLATVDGRAATFEFAATDFADPATATAAEVATALSDGARWLDADDPLHPAIPNPPAAYEEAAGSAARALALAAAPYALNAGDDLQLLVNGEPVLVVFYATDFATPGAATAAEVADRLAASCAECRAGVAVGLPYVETIHTGADARIEVTGGSGIAALGWAIGAAWDGNDAHRVVLYSNTVGTGATIAVTGGPANAVLEFDSDPASGTGGAILGVSDARALYSFDIESERVLSSAQEAIVRRIADYMKPAHTHLVNIRTALPLPWPAGWVLGVDALDETTDLGE